MTQPEQSLSSDADASAVFVRPPPGSAPGTLVVQPDAAPPVMSLFAYGADELVQHAIAHVDEIRAVLGRLPVTWVDVVGIGDTQVISQLGELFEMHHLALADVVHTYQRSKVDEYDDHLFIVIRMADDDAQKTTEQLSIFVGKNYVLTFQEHAGDCFELVRKRLQKAHGRLRQGTADYLAYALLDAVIDSYFPILERFGESMDQLEVELMADPAPHMVLEIHELKRDLLAIRRIVWAQREMINSLLRSDSTLITARTATHLRDCYDHSVELLDIVESYREISSGFIEIFLSMLGIKTNEVMKVLTIIATIFIPLSFIASLYGMNFDTASSPWNMPELKWSFGYPFALGLMGIVALALMLYFRARGWLGGRAQRRARRGAE
jgi:magnesium transporter